MPKVETDRPAMVLRCMVYRAHDEYIAECIDLDLAVGAESPDVAQRSLEQAILGYLKVAVDGGVVELAANGRIEGLLPRPAPLSHRIRYHLYLLRAATQGSHRNFRVFDCPCPA